MAKLLKLKKIRDEENDTIVVCAQFDGPPSQDDLKALGAKVPYPWGYDERQALPSSFLPPEDGWYDVGEA